jgi:signal transduction histidine kinase
MIRRQTNNPERVERLAEAALTAAQRGERLTRQLSAFARRPEFEPEAVEAVTAVRDLEPTFRRLAGGSAPISVVTPPSAGEIRIDRAMFETAMLNMLLNALDAVRGGGDIAVRVDIARVDAQPGEDLKPGDYVRISVVDSGAGMAADVAARAFEPFFTTKEAGEGAGLGLAQVAAFARQSGGAARIQSAPGEGATVSLLLPVRAAGLAGQTPIDGAAAGG